MRKIFLIVFCFGILSAQDMGKKNDMKKDEAKQSVMKHNGMKMDKEVDCPHCTKDKKCEMHAKAEMKKMKMNKEMDCPHCTKDKKCEMHAKAEMKKDDMLKK